VERRRNPVREAVRLRVSDLDQYQRFIAPEREEFEVSLDDFLAYMRREGTETPVMRAGTAFHAIMEFAQAGEEVRALECEGFRFEFADDLPAVALPGGREEPIEAEYAGVLLRGRVDGIGLGEITDYKLTFGPFDAERYAGSLQWRAYLDMTGAKRFRYLVFCAKLDDDAVFVHDVHELVFWSYPEMHDEVAGVVAELAAFVREHLPEMYA